MNEDLTPAGHCAGDVCITCSDEAVEVRVVRLLEDELAMVDTGAGHEEEVSVALVDANVGDQILVHAKEAIAVLDARHPATELRADTGG